MSTTVRERSSARSKRFAAVLLTGLALSGSALAGATPAQAATSGQEIVREAQRHEGKPYVYGAVGPDSFDCSGFTRYVFSRFGKDLPHNSAAQYDAAGVRHITQAAKAGGDLVFMKNSAGSITHVGIYAGNNAWWVAPKSGDQVKLQTLYSDNYVVGRVA